MAIAGQQGIGLSSPVLQIQGKMHGIYRAGEFDQQTVAHHLHQPAKVFLKKRRQQTLSSRLECRQRSSLVHLHQTIVADHIGGQYCG